MEQVGIITTKKKKQNITTMTLISDPESLFVWF